ncbi:hypothetical protein [Flavisphingomonas formosensis]|uniref:hypothetical protein n=1 Tax=Flavisphingomonas formosensis TaxID=861534 RepID=UPI0012F78C81|nr:hypothetical protein [Sphingomonas formosensis]
MRQRIWYRVSVLGAARGPWRDRLETARHDAIQLGLGAWHGERFYLSVPADIERREGAEGA